MTILKHAHPPNVLGLPCRIWSF